MRVAIAGAGNVGRVHRERPRQASGHEVLLIEQNQDVVQRSVAPRRRRRVDRRRRVRGGLAAARRARALRRRRRGHRRRRGQPRHLAARQAGVRRAARRRTREPPEERVAVQRELGRRPVGVDPAPRSPRSSRKRCRSAGWSASCQFEGGNVRLVEVTLAENAPVVDKAIRDLDIPRDATIVAVVRGRPRRDAARRHGLRVRRRSARDGDERLRRRRPQILTRRLTRRCVADPLSGLNDAVGSVRACTAGLSISGGCRRATTSFEQDRDPGVRPRDLAPAEEHRGERCRVRPARRFERRARRHAARCAPTESRRTVRTCSRLVHVGDRRAADRRRSTSTSFSRSLSSSGLGELRDELPRAPMTWADA